MTISFFSRYHFLMESYQGFAPISSPSATILIVGSAPSVTSIEKGEYYGHSTNDFWPIIAAIFNERFTSYDDKVDALIRHNIALWDVLAACRRDKSKDSSIKNGKINNFSRFLHDHPHVKKIVANGKVAYSYLDGIKEDINFLPFYYAPSTSKAYPLSFDKKIALWKPLLS